MTNTFSGCFHFDEDIKHDERTTSFIFTLIQERFVLTTTSVNHKQKLCKPIIHSPSPLKTKPRPLTCFMTGELDSEFDFPVFRHPVDVNILDKFLPGCEIALKGKAWHRQKQILTTKELANLYPDRFSPSSQRRAVCLPTTLSIQSYCSHPATQPGRVL